jgi:hypothetical protein
LKLDFSVAAKVRNDGPHRSVVTVK